MRTGERGSATIIHLTLIAAILMILTAAVGAGSLAAVKTQAAGVADLAALAAAQAGTCTAAGRVVDRNPTYGLALTRCETDGLYAQVQVGRGGFRQVSVTSRAGPDW